MRILIAIIFALLLIFLFFLPHKAKISFFNEGQKVVEIKVDVAKTPQEQQKGLMGKSSLANLAGMIFVFINEQERFFWMKNTLISLDMIFLDKNKKIVKIFKNVLPCQKDPCPSYSSEFPSQYVIEVNSGFCDKYGIDKMTKVVLYF